MVKWVLGRQKARPDPIYSYNYYRSYDSRTGRFTQGDPIGLNGGWNRFGYVEANPLSLTDRFGLQHDRRPNRPGWPDWAQTTQPNPNCATAECAAGLLPPPSENRTQGENLMVLMSRFPCSVRRDLTSSHGISVGKNCLKLGIPEIGHRFAQLWNVK